MLRRFALIVPTLLVAFVILFVSIFRTASVKYEFSGVVNGSTDIQVLGERDTQINYHLAYPGNVQPDSPIWPVKAARDKVWLVSTTNPSRKSELLLLIADKRLGSSRIFFQDEKPEKGLHTLQKAEHYLRQAYEKERENNRNGINTSEFLSQIALASLKHRQVIEEDILPAAPDDARPGIVQTLETTKEIYERATQSLNEKGLSHPKNPFEQQ